MNRPVIRIYYTCGVVTGRFRVIMVQTIEEENPCLLGMGEVRELPL